MTGQRAKNHHFVPKVLQRPFRAADEKIWYATRGPTGFDAPRLVNIDKAFKIRNYYTVLEGDKPSDLIETRFYARIDDYLGKLIPSIMDAFARREVPVFDGAPLTSIQSVVYEMIKRTPDFVSDFDEVSVGREVVEGTIEALQKKGAPNEEFGDLEQKLVDDLKLRQLGRTVRVRAIVSNHSKASSLLSDFSIRFARSAGRSSFILSSMIAYRIGNGGSNALSNPNMEIWMPISPKLTIVLLRDKDKRIPLIYDMGREQMRDVNSYAVRNSRAVASHSQALLLSLLGKRRA